MKSFGIFFFCSSLIILILEIGLRFSGAVTTWKYTSPPMEDHIVHRYQFKAGTFKNHFGVDELQINSRGTRGPEIKDALLLVLGDSCVFGVNLPLELTFPRLLSRSDGSDVINAGVPGANSFHGLSWLESSKILNLKPKLVVIYFGWNDHWRALLPERVFSWIRQGAPYSVLLSKLLRFQESLWSQDPSFLKQHIFSQVPKWEFRHNLKTMVSLIHDAGSIPVLVSAPSEPRLRSRSVWFKSHYMEEFDSHEEYVEVVRELASKFRIPLVDLDAKIKALKAESPWEYFMDFVHLNSKGHVLLARELEPWLFCAQKNNCQVQPSL